MNKNKKQGLKQAKPKKKNKTVRYIPIKDSNMTKLILLVEKDILKEFIRQENYF
jgi:hypothetical protein